MSLNNLAASVSGVGRREEALAPAQEVVALRRQLAEAAPAAYLGGLAASLSNLAVRLSEAGRREEASCVFPDVAAEMRQGLQARIYLAQADWLAADLGPGSEDRACALQAAITAANSEEDPVTGAQARRSVRAVISGEATLSGLSCPDAPLWLRADLPDDVVEFLDELLAVPTWAARAEALSQSPGQLLFTPQARLAREALASLYADSAQLSELLAILDDADRRGLAAVLADVRASEEFNGVLDGWLRTQTWTASRQYLSAHPGLLTDDRTLRLLAGRAGDRVIRQHLAIVRLAKTMSLDDVYDIVLDSADATAAALASIDQADLERTTEIWHAAPQLGSEPFIGTYLAAILLTAGGQSEDGQKIMATAARQAGPHARQAGAERIRRLAGRIPEEADALTSLAAVLISELPPEASPGPHQATDASEVPGAG
jgi:hypothetical protein